MRIMQNKRALLLLLTVINQRQPKNPMDPHITPDYLNTKLAEILQALHQDIEKNAIKHKNQLILLKEIIEAKDKEIKELTEQAQCYRRLEREGQKDKDVHTSSFKRITLGKKTPKNISQFNSESFMTIGRIAESVLLDQKENTNVQKCKIEIPKLNTNKSIKNIKSFISPRLPKSPRLNQKENLILSVKKSIDQNPKKLERSITTKPSIGRQQNSNKKGKTIKNSLSKQKTDRQKKCISIVIPKANFCAYSINPSKVSRKQSTTKLL